MQKTPHWSDYLAAYDDRKFAAINCGISMILQRHVLPKLKAHNSPAMMTYYLTTMILKA